MPQRGAPSIPPPTAARPTGARGAPSLPPETLSDADMDRLAPQTLPPGFFDAQDHPPEDHRGSVREYLGGLAHSLNPIPAIQGLSTAYGQHREDMRKAIPIPGTSIISDMAAGGLTAWDAIKAMAAAHEAEAQKAREAPTSSEFFGHALAATLPIVGPPAAHAGEEIGKGNVARGLGEGTGLILPTAAAEVMRAVPIPALLKSRLTPEQASAVEFMDREGIPVDIASRTGNPAVRGAQRLLETSPGGAGAAMTRRMAQKNAIAETGENIRQSIEPGLGPTHYSEETAGRNILDSLQKRIDRFGENADKAYEELRAIEADPKNAKVVQLGTEEKLTSVGGSPYTVPRMGSVSMPVDIRSVKNALRPLYERISKTMPIAQKEASPGFTALKNLMESDDYVSASTADANLSAIKSIVRKSETAAGLDKSGGVASRALSELSAQIDATMQGAGTKAVQALNRGRALTRAKYETADVLEQLPVNEPVQVFKTLTQSRDTRVNLLRDVNRLAPQDLPKVGRAWLEGLLEHATKEGGFQGEKGLARQWETLGNESKYLMFKDRQVIKNLDDYFLAAKMVAENPNPSGTATVIQLLPHGELLYHHPATGMAVMVGEYALANMLTNKSVGQAIVRGLKVPVSNRVAAAAIINQITRASGNTARPIPPPEQQR